MVDELTPQLIIASVSAAHFARIQLTPASEPSVVYSVEQKLGPYQVSARRVHRGEDQPLLVWAPASTTPFQPISHADKRRAGAAVLDYLRG